ncbi:F-box/kelch-repeat-like protein isoform X2 [Cinnamomum micranthum f. kanehirae]|uniref:F-box/kelch-repeat-like protein isoform X2 n=1 Tax=Cinnamomum micranthum f. kanehirae TaxID=337451 RepID=A0A3S3NY30_9MAGN|nr:F-box/kelch-repeat-like protein isoform X2 [Cinnamomum micranthum f. kanehirae]
MSEEGEENQLRNLIPGLPDEIALDCLVRVPYRFHSTLKSVCHGWKDLLTHPSFLRHRKIAQKQESFVCLVQAVTTTQTAEIADSTPEKEKSQIQFSPPVYGLTVYNASAETWHRIPSSPVLPSGIPMFCQCVAVAGKLVLIGGWDPTTLDSVADVYVYDFIHGGGWRRGAPMSVARSFFACAVVGPAVYVAGGHDNQKNALRSAEVYDSDSDTWRDLPRMGEERDECQGLTCGDGRFWVVSGYGTENQGRFDSGAECFDAARSEWTRVEGVWPFPNASPRGSCCEIPRREGEQITRMPLPSFPSVWFVGPSSGGSMGRNQGLREYDEKDRSWKVTVQMPDGICSSPCATGIKGGIFVIGCGGSEGGPHRFRACVLDGGSRKWAHVDTPGEFSGFVYSASSISL